MTPAEQIIKAPDEEIVKIASQLRLAYQLKRTIRYASARDTATHSESVAEHVFGMLFLAQYFLPLEDPQKQINRERVYEMLLFHDFGEIPNGDIPYNIKNKQDEEQEARDAKLVFDSLPPPLQTLGQERWQEYEDRQTPESFFVFALDKIEPLFELLDPLNEKSLKRIKFTYKAHTEKKLKATENFPIMRKFTEVLTERMRQRNVFWEPD